METYFDANCVVCIVACPGYLHVVSCHWVYGLCGSHISVFIYKTFIFIVAPGYICCYFYLYIFFSSSRLDRIPWFDRHWWWLHKMVKTQTTKNCYIMLMFCYHTRTQWIRNFSDYCYCYCYYYLA